MFTVEHGFKQEIARMKINIRLTYINYPFLLISIRSSSLRIWMEFLE